MFFGWWVVAGGALIQTLSFGLLSSAFGAYFVHLQAEFGWSRTVLSGSYSLTSAVGGAMGPVQGPVIDRLGPRAVARAGIVIFGLGLLALSFVHSTLAFYAAFVAISIGTSLSGWVTLNVAAANWFRRRRATAMGFISAGGTIGGLAVPAVAWALNEFGWRHTVQGTAAIVLLGGLPLTLLLRNRPEDYGLEPDGGSSAPPDAASKGTPSVAAASEASAGFTAKQAVRTPAFWFIALGHTSAVILVSVVNIHMIPHLVQQLDFSLELASAMLAVVTIFALVGQVLGGLVADRLEKRWVAAGGMAGHVLGMFALAFATSLGWVLAFAVLHGLAWGIRGPLMSAIRADYFGRKALGTILGLSMLALSVGNVMGPLVSGFMVDRTDSYRPGFIILGAVAGLGVLAFLAARRPGLPRRRPEAPARAPGR